MAAGAGVKLDLTQMQEIANIIRDSLKDDMKDTIKDQLPGMVKNIVSGVIDGLNKQINELEKDNKTLKKENKELKARVAKLETRSDAAEQYSRRNSLRMSGVKEDTVENTDDLVLERANAVGASISIAWAKCCLVDIYLVRSKLVPIYLGLYLPSQTENVTV